MVGAIHGACRHRDQTVDPGLCGLLGMAGVLTVSANGVETSPVNRGVWVAENILGNPPPPPPDEVPAIDTDVRGATTIRELMAATKRCRSGQ